MISTKRTRDDSPAERAVLLIELPACTVAFDLATVIDVRGRTAAADEAAPLSLPAWLSSGPTANETSGRRVRLQAGTDTMCVALPACARLSTAVARVCPWPGLVAALGQRAPISALLELPERYAYLLDGEHLVPAPRAGDQP